MMCGVAGRDTRTRYQGVFARHQQHCAIADGSRCNCKPTFYGVVWDRARNRHVKTKRMPTIVAARNARSDLSGRVERGELPDSVSIRLSDARAAFVSAAREGRALNKQGRRYKPRAVDDIDEVLRVHVDPTLGTRRISNIRRSHVQSLIDELTPELSGSRIRSIVNGLRSLYRWAQDRELTSHDPAALVRLPAMGARPIERVATPSEFAQLLAALEPEDALPYALAGYAMGRRAQIVRLRWPEIDFKLGALEWGVEWEARKYEASRRVVPIVPPLLVLLKRVYMERGRPKDGLVCRPRTERATTGLLNTGWLAKRTEKIWADAKLRPITLQEARHTAATWLDAAGVAPKIASVLMGHATPERQPGAAQITLARYTHALPQDIERARVKLAAYLADAQTAEVAGR